MPFKPNSFFKFNVNHYDFFINLRDLHKIFYTLERGDLLPFFVYKFFFGYIIKDVTERYNYNREVTL